MFIDGVTVLNQMEGDTFNALAFVIGSMVGCIVLLGLFFFTDLDSIAFLAIPGALVIGLVCSYIFPDPPTTQYQVTIDENVSMVEFYEKYEVIEQNGQIFTIEIKENDEDVAG